MIVCTLKTMGKSYCFRHYRNVINFSELFVNNHMEMYDYLNYIKSGDKDLDKYVFVVNISDKILKDKLYDYLFIYPESKIPELWNRYKKRKKKNYSKLDFTFEAKEMIKKFTKMNSIVETNKVFMDSLKYNYLSEFLLAHNLISEEDRI